MKETTMMMVMIMMRKTMMVVMMTEGEDRHRLVATMALIESRSKEDGDDDARKQ